MPKGQENVDRIIDICREIIEVLDGMPSAGGLDVEAPKALIGEIIVNLKEISGKFFLKSNPSIPPTSACLKRAEGVRRTLQEPEVDNSKFLDALEGFKKASESLVKSASMGSTIIT